MKNLFSILRFPFLMSLVLLAFVQTNVALSAPLVAQITASDTEIELGETVTLTLSDVNGETNLAYAWNAFIKGSWRSNQGGTLSSQNTASTTWTPPANQTGVYLITGSIRDAGTRAGTGRQNQDSIEITVTQADGNSNYEASIISDPGPNKTYGLGDTIAVAIKATESATRLSVNSVSGTPQITIKMDPRYGEKQASYSVIDSSLDVGLVFNYTVVEPNLSTKGIAIIGNSITLNGGRITLYGTTTNVTPGFPGVNHDPNHKVDWRLPSDPDSPPTVESVSITSTPNTGTPNTYGLDDTIVVAVKFDQKVIAKGFAGGTAAYIDIDFDLQETWGTKRARYFRGSGTTTLEFGWIVRWPNFSEDGVAVLADTLRLKNDFCHIRNEFGVDAILTHDGTAANPNHKVNAGIAGAANAPAKPKGTLVTTWAALKQK